MVRAEGASAGLLLPGLIATLLPVPRLSALLGCAASWHYGAAAQARCGRRWGGLCYPSGRDHEIVCTGGDTIIINRSPSCPPSLSMWGMWFMPKCGECGGAHRRVCPAGIDTRTGPRCVGTMQMVGAILSPPPDRYSRTGASPGCGSSTGKSRRATGARRSYTLPPHAMRVAGRPYAWAYGVETCAISTRFVPGLQVD